MEKITTSLIIGYDQSTVDRAASGKAEGHEMSVVHTGYVIFFYTKDDRLFWVTENGIILGSNVDDIPDEAKVFKESELALGYWKESYLFDIRLVILNRYISILLMNYGRHLQQMRINRRLKYREGRNDT